MLITYGQFQTKQAIKSSNDLLMPRTVLQENIRMPHTAVIHYLDWNSTEQFPTRSMRQLAGAPKNKRIPLHHVLDIKAQEEVQMLEDRYIDKKVREWQRANMENFRVVDLTTIPNNDIQTNAIVNYNLLKSQYKYKPTATSSLSKYQNIMTEFWSTVNTCASISPVHQQFVTLAIPSALPSRAIMDRMLTLPAMRFAKVVSTPELQGIVQLYQYLNVDTRSKSVMAPLEEVHTPSVTLELTYKGYSVFCKLSYLISLLKSSKLENKTKLPLEAVQKALLAILLKTQKAVESKLQGDDPELVAEDQHDADPSAINPNHILDDTGEDIEDNPPLTIDPDVQELQVPQVLSGATASGLNAAVIMDKKFNNAFDDTDLAASLSNLIDKEVTELEGDSDTLFISSISKSDPPPPKTTTATNEAEQVSPHIVDTSEENILKVLKDRSVQEKFDDYLTEVKGFDAVSTAEIRSMRKMREKRLQMKSPYAPNQTIDEFKVITPEDLTLPPMAIPIDNDLVADHLKNEVLFNLDKKYTQGPMKKHIAACVTHLENFDIVVKDYEVEKVTDSIGAHEVHKLVLRPLRGKESTVYFRLPVINDEGEFIAGGVKYKMRRQKADMVLRKYSPIRVGLTTNYNKLFIGRTERKAFDPYENMADQIKRDYLETKGNITKIAPANRFKNEITLPNTYAAMSRHFNDLTTPTHRFFFNYDQITNHIDQKVHDELRKKNLVFVGHDSKAHVLVMDQSNQIFDYTSGMTEVGKLETLLQLDTAKIPKAFSTIKVLGDDIPLGVALSYYMGLNNLVAVTKSSMEVFPPRKQVTAPAQGVVLQFSDAKLVVTCPNTSSELLFAGFLFYKNFTKTQTLESFYNKNIYLDMLEFRDAGLMHLKELDMLREGFIDPISRDNLIAQGEPTEYLPLLLRANELLETFQHLDINDPTYSRIRGYDRLPGLMYRALAESVRSQRMKGGKGKIELDPYKVWKYVTQDTTVKVTEDNNPITDVKETEAVTFSGLDGLSRTATPEKLRKFHVKDKGLASEATVDSTDVALNFSVTPYAKIKSLLGDIDMEHRDVDEHPEMAFSTSMQLVPMSENDD